MRVKITNIKAHRTRNGQDMAFIEAFNHHTVVVMPNLYPQVKELLTIGNWIELEGFKTPQGKILATQIKPILLPVTQNALVLA